MVKVRRFKIDLSMVDHEHCSKVTVMAYRDLTGRFLERRANLRKRNLRFQMRPRLDNSPLLGALFLSKQVRRCNSWTAVGSWSIRLTEARYRGASHTRWRRHYCRTQTSFPVQTTAISTNPSGRALRMARTNRFACCTRNVGTRRTDLVHCIGTGSHLG